MEVLQIIAEGSANKGTAAEPGIGIKTVEKHWEYLVQKLNIHDTAGLTFYSISVGIIESRVQLNIVQTTSTQCSIAYRSIFNESLVRPGEASSSPN